MTTLAESPTCPSCVMSKFDTTHVGYCDKNEPFIIAWGIYRISGSMLFMSDAFSEFDMYTLVFSYPLKQIPLECVWTIMWPRKLEMVVDDMTMLRKRTPSTHCPSISVFYDTVSSVKNGILTPFIIFHFAMQIFEYCYLHFSKLCQCNYNREFFTTFSHILLYLHFTFYSDSWNVSIANTLYIGKLFCDHTVHYLNNWQVYFWFINRKLFIYVIKVNYFLTCFFRSSVIRQGSFYIYLSAFIPN